MANKKKKIVTLEQLDRDLRRRSPKTMAKIDRRWDIKMIGPVTDFVIDDILAQMNPRLVKLARKNEYIFHGPEVERALWKLLTKVRRITLAEKRK